MCNWMVSTGVGGAMMSSSLGGMVLAMWMPIMLFFAMAFEHSVVNRFLFPSALIMGGHFSVMDYLIWNEIPTVLGNMVGGLTFTRLTPYATHLKTAPKRSLGKLRRVGCGIGDSACYQAPEPITTCFGTESPPSTS